MNLNLKNRLNSYAPLWDKWYIKEEIYSDKFPNVYKIRNEDDGRISIIKVFNINAETFSNTMKCSINEVGNNIFRIINNMVQMEVLKGCNNFAPYSNALIKEITQENRILSYDIIFKMDNVECLYTKIKKDYRFSQKEVVKMLNDILGVLSVAHDKKLIHKYINPQTILFDRHGSYKLGDFYVYSLLSASKDDTYLAPEVLNNQRNSIQSDIFSLGLVAYQLLNNNNFTKAFDNGLLPSINDVNPDLMKIVQKMCNINPSQRYASASEVIQDLKNISVKPINRIKSTPKGNNNVPSKSRNNINPNDEEMSKVRAVPVEVISDSNDEVEKDNSNVVPLVIACIVVAMIGFLFGFMIYKNNSSTTDSLENLESVQITTTTEEVSMESIPTEYQEEIYTTIPTELITETIPETTTSMSETETVYITTIPTTVTQPTTRGTTIPATVTQVITTTTTTQPITTTTTQPITTTVTTTTPITTNTSDTVTPQPSDVKHNYYFKQGSFTWQEAYNDALNNGYQLATFTNMDEFNAIRNVAKSSGLKYFWLGGKVKIYDENESTPRFYCYWENGDDSSILNTTQPNWYYSEKYKVQEPSGWDINTGEMEPYIMLWYLDDWSLCDNGVNACENANISGYIYMD